MSRPIVSLAFDLGASNGRAVLGRFDGRRMTLSEVHRFANDPVEVPDGLHWDILRLYQEMQTGMLKAIGSTGDSLCSLGIDSWAVDYGLLDGAGRLLYNPFHYRDARTNGMMERVFERIPRRELFFRTGIQMLPFNTIFQLAAERERHLDGWDFGEAQTLLLIPDLLAYFLTGEKVTEWTNATTTQLVNASTGVWDTELLQKVHVPNRLFTSIVQPGTVTGGLLPRVRNQIGLGTADCSVIAVAEHDTASAVAAVPAKRGGDFAYISCGTWSLLGTELAAPQIDDRSYAYNFTNEGGIHRTSRFLKNIMGLWILQECRRTWQRDGESLDYEDMMRAAQSAPAFLSWIDPDDERFLPPGDMPSRIADYCSRSGQPVPRTIGEIARCVIESLALKYAVVLHQLEQAVERSMEAIYIVGGGVSNRMLCQATADATGKTVVTGPAEATAIGNLAVQWIAQKELSDVRQARELIASSWPSVEYTPMQRDEWQEAMGRFLRVTGL